MAENNRNWDKNQYQQSNDWEQNRNRFNQNDDQRNREDNRYGNAGYSGNYDQDSGQSYGNSQYGSSAGNSRMNEGYGGSYNSDFGSQGNNYQQSNWNNDSWRQPNWQNSEYMNQQGLNDQRQRSSYGNSGQQNWNQQDQDWQNRNRGNSSGYGENRQNMSGNYNQGSDRNYGSGYGRTDWNDQYRNTGYGSMGNSSNYGNRNDYRGQQNRSHHDHDRNWWDRTKDEVSSWFGGDDSNERRDQDRMSGPHRGKGPKDYRRSEDRIREDVCDRLADDDRVDASDIQVQIQNDEVILTGTVNSREEKRRAEDLVESISGVRNVENRIRVGRTDPANFDRYTGTTGDVSGIGKESGTTNEVIRNTGNEKTRNKS